MQAAPEQREEIMSRAGKLLACVRGDAASQRGLALLVVLWIVASAALLVSAFNATVRSGVSMASSEVALSRAEALVDAGAEIAAARLIDDDEARRWLPDGRPHEVSFADARLTIAIHDPNGLVDLNKADGVLLFGLFRQFAGSEANATRLRDQILEARGQASGGERAKAGQSDFGRDLDAQQAGEAGAAAFMSVAQFRGLKDMTLDLYRRVAPFVTVYGRDGRVNPVTAPGEVLASIPNLSAGDVERLRISLSAARQDDRVLAEFAQRAGAYLTDEAGPAYVVSVKAAKRGDSYRGGKVFVLVTGLDQDAPYRLLSKQALAGAE
jgi:general secretion pathway protein K